MAIKQRRKGGRGEATRRILDATLSLLTQGDLDSLSLGKIARKAGVSKSLLLYYYHTKEELILRAQYHFFENLLRTISHAHPGAGISDAFSAMDEIFKALQSLPSLFPLFRSASKRGDLLPRFFDELRDLTEEAIETFLGSETLESLGIPVSSLREILFLIFLGLILFTPISEKKRIPSQEVYEVFKEILRGYVALRENPALFPAKEENPFPPDSSPPSLPDRGLHPQI